MTSEVRSGFTLIEVLLVFFFLGAVAIPLFGYFTASAGTIEEVTLHQIAGAVAASQMETYRNQPYRQVSRITGEIDLGVPRDFRAKLDAKLRVKEIVPGKLLRITVTASWSRPRRGEVTLATLLANQKPSSRTAHE